MDAGERREAVVDAVLRVAERDGVRGASLRGVAVEAGLNIGSVRHYFAGHQELLRFAMQSVIDRTSARLERHRETLAAHVATTPGERLDALAELLAELLPLDENRRRENAVLLEFLVAARTDPDLDALSREAIAGVTALARRVLEAIGADASEVECQRLAALVDGLGLRCVLQPELVTVDAVAALRAHLDALTRPRNPPRPGGDVDIDDAAPS